MDIDRDSITVMVVAAPTQTVDAAAVQKLSAFVDAGGAALLLLETATIDQQSPFAVPVQSGLDPILEGRGVQVAEGIVFDLASSERVTMPSRGMFNIISPYPLWPVALPASDHVMTRGLSAMTLGWAAALDIQDSVTVTPLWQTTEAGGLQGPGGPIMPDQDWNRPAEDLGVHTLAVAIEPAEGTPSGRMVVVGDGSFAEGQFLQANPANLAFVANAIEWLAQDETLMSIRSKVRTPPALVMGSDAGRNILKWTNLVGVPVLFALFGLLRVSGRRRRAEARWQGVLS